MSGYYVFGSTVLDQITLSLEQSSKAAWLMDCLTMLLVLSSFSKVTLTMFPLAHGINDLVMTVLPPCGDKKKTESVSVSIVKLTLTIVALMVSLFAPSFSFVVALVGLICTMTVSVIFPSVAYLQLFGPKLSMGTKVLTGSFAVGGVFLAIAGTVDRFY